MSDAQENSLLRVMSLHALLYCERLFYLEEVEEIRVADSKVYAGRRLHTELERLEDDESWLQLELADASLGIRGKVDCIRRRGGVLIPYEHKKGRSKPGEQGSLPWPSDRIQAGAYGLLVEAATQENVPEVRLRYHADGVLIKLLLDESLRNDVRSAIERAKQLTQKLERPPVAIHEKLCEHCSLATVCLPEEERLLQDPARRPTRVFPEHETGQVIHVLEPGTRVGRSGECLSLTPLEGEIVRLPSGRVDEIVLHGATQISSQALGLCTHQDIGVHWLTGGGVYLGGLVRGTGQVQRRLRQYEALRDGAVCESLARRLTQAKVEGQLRFLLRASRGEERSPELEIEIEAIRIALEHLAKARGLDSIRGHEGDAARHYFAALPQLFSKELAPDFIPDGRSKRPPKDKVNAVLSFGYALLHREVLSSILVCGLEPSFGFYHQPRSAAHPLALDVMELFRVSVVDMPVVASFNRKQWAQDDFMVGKEQVWLSDMGKKKAIKLYEQRRKETWKHPVTGYSLSYSRHMELEVRLLEKEWSGAPGLFAKMRLR